MSLTEQQRAELDATIRDIQAGKLWAHELRSLVTRIAAEAEARGMEKAAEIAEAMCPTGGRQWTDEQCGAFEALTACATAIRARAKGR